MQATGVDPWVRRIGLDYDVRGQLLSVRSYNNPRAGTLVNEVLHVYLDYA